MSREAYELISTEENRCETDALTSEIMPRRNAAQRKTRMAIVFLFMVLCAIITLVVLKVTENSQPITDTQVNFTESTIKPVGSITTVPTSKIETTTTPSPITTLKISSSTTPLPVVTTTTQVYNTTENREIDKNANTTTTAPSVSTSEANINSTAETTTQTTSPLPKTTISSTAIPPTTTTTTAKPLTTPQTTPKTTTSVQTSPATSPTVPAPPVRRRRSVETELSLSPLYRKSPAVCNTLSCKTAATRMLRLMDNSAEPCDDFYQFACGGIKENAPRDENVLKTISNQILAINGTSPVFLQKLKTFYDSCIAHERQFNYEARLATVSRLVKEVGKIVPETSEAEVDLVKVVSKLFLRRAIPFLDFDIGIESKETGFLLKLTLSNQIPVLKETGPWLEQTDDQILCLSEQKKDLLAKDIDLNKIHNAYIECQKKHSVYLTSIENAVRAFELLTGDEANQTQQLEDIKTTIINLFLNQINELPLLNKRKRHELWKIAKLQETYPFIQWKSLFETLTGRAVDDTSSIQIAFTDYCIKVLDSLKNVPVWKINNALISIYGLSLYESLVVPQAKHTREDYCLRLGSKTLPDVYSHIYSKTWSEEDAKKSQDLLINIFNQLKIKFSGDIEKSQWLDEATKSKMLSKLNNEINLLLNGNQESFSDAGILQSKYENLVLNASNFIENTVSLLEISRKSLYDLHGKPYDVKYLWGNIVNSFDTVPKSVYATGLIVAPLGLVQRPINEEYPSYLSMAELGLSLAREVARQFDFIGMEHGLTLSDTSRKYFENYQSILEEKAILNGDTVLKKQKLSYQANPLLSSNERLVDNAAAKMVTESLYSFNDESVIPWVSSMYNNEKVFFIALAQGYCKNIDIPEFMYDLYDSELLPPSLRVKNIITNSEAFQKVFECPSESAMNSNPTKLQFPAI